MIEDIVRSERQAGRTPLLTSLKQRIMRRVPGFDEKKLGFSGFKKLMLRTADEGGTIRLVTVGLVDWVIMADEPTPEEALTDSRSGRSSVETVAADEEVVLDDQSQAEPSAEAETGSEPESDSGTRVEAEEEEAEPEAESVDLADRPAAEDETEATSGLPVAATQTLSEPDSLTVEVQTETEASSDAAESGVKTEEVAPPALAPELAEAWRKP